MTGDNEGSGTVSFEIADLTAGYPAILDSSFIKAIGDAKQGGLATQAYFDAANDTSDYWTWLAEMNRAGENAWVPGTARDGTPVMLASNGNTEMMLRADYQAPGSKGNADDDAPVVGLATVATGNTTNNTSQTLVGLIKLAEKPAGSYFSDALFEALLSPLYENLKMVVSNLATTLSVASRVEAPSIDPATETEPVLNDASGTMGAGEEAAEQGIEYLALDWSSALTSFAGLAVVGAIPLVVEFLAHNMTHCLQINNLTDGEFIWSIDFQASGSISVQPSVDFIPGVQSHEVGGKPDTLCAYQAGFEFINTNDFGSIGYTLNLRPSDGSSVASIVVSVPWAGTNAIWVGAPSSSPQATYDAHSAPNGALTQTATFDGYQATLTISRLTGTTEGQYFYASILAIEPIK